jgi:ureidoglycolate dehydrogenase (NAD+)
VTRVPASVLSPYGEAILTAIGFPPDHAAVTTECLIEASLRGVDTHGIGRLSMYARVVRSGKLPANANIRVLRDDGGATALIDGGGGLGFVPATRAMMVSMEKARRFGVGAVGVVNSSHFGMAACYPLQAARKGFLGIGFTNADRLISAPTGRGRMIGNNPIAFAAPAGNGPPIVLDIACSVAANARVRAHLARGEKLPDTSWGFDQRGQPTDDPASILEGGSLAPFAGHKGFGIALFMEIFCGVLTGGPFGKNAHAGLHYGGTKDDKIGHFFIALEIGRFVDPEDFGRRMEELVAQLKGFPSAPGHTEIRLPGEQAERLTRDRLANGIPLDDDRVHELLALGTELGVTAPF